MAVEPKRGCGYRKVGALYLVADKEDFVACHRLPVAIPEIKFFRGYKSINPYKLLYRCDKLNLYFDCVNCTVCNPPDEDNHGLMFVGKKFYTAESFTKEAMKLGISKRIANIPENFKLGKTVVYLAMQDIEFKIEGGSVFYNAIFMSFKPKRIEKIITETQAKNEEFMKELKEKGITPVVVPDNDPDHQ